MRELWRHQIEAIEFVERLWASGFYGAMLALIMGAGKSRTAIELARRNRLSPILIACPLRVVPVWPEQFREFAPEYEVLGLDEKIGSVADKAARARDFLSWATARGKPCVIVCNYESLRLPPLGRWVLTRRWPLVIADEIHRCKSNSGAISRFIGRLGLLARRRLGLTGTPMPHSPLDVWAEYRFLDRTIYDPTYTSFRSRYAVMDTMYNQKVKHWRDLDDLREKFFSIAFQVGAEVLDLPGEQDQVLSCQLGTLAQRLYLEMERDLIAWVAADQAVTAKNALVRLLRLEQITSGVVKDEAGQEMLVDESKRRLLEDLLEDLAPEEPVVVFCVFKADLAAVHAAARVLGRRSGEVSGDHTLLHRDDLEAWKRGGPEDPVILAVQIQAGSEGISLVRARIAVYYSIGFSLFQYLQSRARLCRPGQTRPVMFYHLIATHTIDETIRRALDRRQDLVESVLKELRCQTSNSTPPIEINC